MSAGRAPRGIREVTLPGFVDIQVNGGFGCDFTSEPDSIWEVGAQLPRTGVTAFVPTIVSAPPDVGAAAMEVLEKGPPVGWIGAKPIGLHLEGPMISPARRGTHELEYLVLPTPGVIDRLIEAGPPVMVTIAPELDGAEDAIRRLVSAGTIVSLGHSAATAPTAAAAVDWGATHATHLYNAMSGLDHRDPGLAAMVLLDARVTTGLIADGIHVAPEMLSLALHAKGVDKIALVTDAMAALGADQGTHRIGSTTVTVEGITVRNAAGDLAGSAATMSHVFREMMRATGCTIADASTMASQTPSRVVGHRAHPGDIVVLDSELDVVSTYIGGDQVYSRSTR